MAHNIGPLNIERKPCGPLYLALFPFPHLELKFESDFYLDS